MTPPLQRYRFRLLRYAPNAVSGEFFNIAAVLYDERGRILDARFAPDLNRLQCNPAVEMGFLLALRREFEDKLLSGEGFSDYIDQLRPNLSNTLYFTDDMAIESRRSPGEEIERLATVYTSTPAAIGVGHETRQVAGTRGAVRNEIEAAFARHRLFADGLGVNRNIAVAYGGPRLSFTFDYGYRPSSGGDSWIHALGARNEIQEASRLCLVYDRLRHGAEKPARLAAVIAEEVSADARELLASSEIEPVSVADLDALAEKVRLDLGL